MPLISVIVPVYQVEPYLHRCVDSILAQTLTDFELILVDDGSPDNCGAICDEYAAKDSRIHVIHQENGGLSAARNAGIDWVFAHSDSQWITFVDSDDLIQHEMLEVMLDCVLKNSADICVCKLQIFESENDIKPFTGNCSSTILSNRAACMRLYDNDGANMTVSCAKLFRRTLFFNLRFPKGKLHEDEATTYRALYSANQVVDIKAPFYCYRVNPTSIMNSGFSAKRFDALEALEDRKRFFQEKGEAELIDKTSWAYRTTHAKLIVFAFASGKEDEIPNQYRLSLGNALRCLRKELSDDKYTYYLAKIHPNWLLPHAYLRKIKKILHIPCQ
jgi:glycosyltransferase involved in cell wall biosynthesis